MLGGGNVLRGRRGGNSQDVWRIFISWFLSVFMFGGTEKWAAVLTVRHARPLQRKSENRFTRSSTSSLSLSTFLSGLTQTFLPLSSLFPPLFFVLQPCFAPQLLLPLLLVSPLFPNLCWLLLHSSSAHRLSAGLTPLAPRHPSSSRTGSVFCLDMRSQFPPEKLAHSHRRGTNFRVQIEPSFCVNVVIFQTKSTFWIRERRETGENHSVNMRSAHAALWLDESLSPQTLGQQLSVKYVKIH